MIHELSCESDANTKSSTAMKTYNILHGVVGVVTLYGLCNMCIYVCGQMIKDYFDTRFAR